jgi:hypothetical protein
MSQPDKGFEEPEYDGKANWKNAQDVATGFFAWLYHPQRSTFFSSDVDLTSVEREKVHELFVMYARTELSHFHQQKPSQRKRLESIVMAALKKQRRMKAKRYNDGVVVCSFALSNGKFASYHDRITARDKLRKAREDLLADKCGVTVAAEPLVTPELLVFPVNTDVDVKFAIVAEEDTVELVNVTFTGPKKNSYQAVTTFPLTIDSSGNPVLLCLSLHTSATTIYRADVVMHFRPIADTRSDDLPSFSIVRSLSLYAARDQAMVQQLLPVTPYRREKKLPGNDRPFKKSDILDPPVPRSGERPAATAYKRLKQFKIPTDVRVVAPSRGEAEATLERPTQDTPEQDLPLIYQTFWQEMLWMSELQTYEDMKLFDLENVSLKRHKLLFKMSVPGLAEGRPSVLRGDIVLCHWKRKQYRGRVDSVLQLDLVLEFHDSLHRFFDIDLGRLDLVRFTFSRTSFRTSHQGCLLAPSTMKPAMLMPKPIHIQNIKDNMHQRKMRILPKKLAWASRTLNEEQKEAVEQVVRGTLRPMPYVIFGPPGTG